MGKGATEKRKINGRPQPLHNSHAAPPSPPPPAQIAKYCPGRSDNAIKNRFDNCLLSSPRKKFSRSIIISHPPQRYHATCRNKHMQVDLSELNLPLFIEDAEAVYESVR